MHHDDRISKSFHCIKADERGTKTTDVTWPLGEKLSPNYGTRYVRVCVRASRYAKHASDGQCGVAGERKTAIARNFL